MYSPHLIIFECNKCGGPLDIQYDYRIIKEEIVSDMFLKQQISHWKYWPFYPIKQHDKIVSFKEGGTPLIKSNKQKGYSFKYEAVNPTGSFKDRGSTVEITKAREISVNKVICASTGNMGASIAAYAARANIQATVYVPSIATGEKITQIKNYGAKVVKIKGDYEDALAKTKEQRRKYHTYLTGDYPYRGEGEKSVGFEIIDQHEWETPDYIVCPIGNATLLYAVYKALWELKQVKLLRKIPKIVGVQSTKCQPVVKAFNDKKPLRKVKNPQTVASAIACGNPVDGIKAVFALKKSRGKAIAVTEKEILSARKELGKQGLYVEPSGAVSYAGAQKLGLKGEVVCVLSGHGLKDSKLY